MYVPYSMTVRQTFTREAIYVSDYTETRSCNHCCLGREITITYSECESVVLGIQHVMRTRHIVICRLLGCTAFFHRMS